MVLYGLLVGTYSSSAKMLDFILEQANCFGTEERTFFRFIEKWQGVTLMPLMIFPENDDEDENITVNAVFAVFGDNFNFINR